jgi:hypothetical protein
LCGTVDWLDLGDGRHLPMAKKPNKSHLGGTWNPWITVKLQWWYVVWMNLHDTTCLFTFYNTCTPVQDHPF